MGKSTMFTIFFYCIFFYCIFSSFFPSFLICLHFLNFPSFSLSLSMMSVVREEDKLCSAYIQRYDFRVHISCMLYVLLC